MIWLEIIVGWFALSIVCGVIFGLVVNADKGHERKRQKRFWRRK
jgi:hypothetical protein